MISKCGYCPRSSSVGDGWWQVHDYKTEPPTVSHQCPSCYRNKSLLVYRDTLLEAIQAIDTKDEDHDFTIAMEVMRLRCIAVIRDTTFND
jgi:hypothetical protein